MGHGFVTEGIVRCLDRMAEVSRGRITHASEEGPNDRKGQCAWVSMRGYCTAADAALAATGAGK